MDKHLTVAICNYNGAHYLPDLIASLRKQECPVPFDILVIDNNSTDNTREIIEQLSAHEGAALRYVKEEQQGIPYARNRAIEESLSSTYMAFIDTDELPGNTWLQAAVDALDREGAECVGGEIRVKLPGDKQPRWLTTELLDFLGRVNNGENSFWITDRKTPVWSGNVAYRTSIFQNGLRFDVRYNRAGKGVGGGSDGIMFQDLLRKKTRIRYRPDMLIKHLVGKEKITRRFFFRLHYIAGKKFGQYKSISHPTSVLGVPPFMIRQLFNQWARMIIMLVSGNPHYMRQAMNASYAYGNIIGLIARQHTNKE